MYVRLKNLSFLELIKSGIIRLKLRYRRDMSRLSLFPTLTKRNLPQALIKKSPTKTITKIIFSVDENYK